MSGLVRYNAYGLSNAVINKPLPKNRRRRKKKGERKISSAHIDFLAAGCYAI